MILLPFLHNMDLITRGNGLGQIPNGYSPITFLSFLFPQMTKFISVIEPSMINYYIGLITILLIPMILAKRQKNKKNVSASDGSSVFIMYGRKFFFTCVIVSVLSNVCKLSFPDLEPSIYCCIFTIDPCTCFAGDFGIRRSFGNSTTVFNWPHSICGDSRKSVGAVIANTNNVDEAQNAEQIKAFSESAIRLGVLLIGYFIGFYAIYKKQLEKIWRNGLVIGLVITEVFSWSYWETPITIARYQQGDYSRSQETRDAIDKEFTKYNERKRGENFAGHSRSTNGLNSKNIVFRQTFDEEGYCSFLLSATAGFVATYFRNIIEQNPEVYFTNHVITSEDMSYEEWVNKADNTPEQIYAERGVEEKISSYQMLNAQVKKKEELDLTTMEQSFVVSGPLSAGKNKTGRLRIYWDTVDAVDTVDVPMELTFVDSEGNQQAVSGKYLINEQEGRYYTDIYFPSVEKEYHEIQGTTQEKVPIGAELVETEKMVSDGIVEVSWFGFNSIRMTVNAPTEGYVTVLQAKHKGWKAYVDGEAGEIDLVNNCFMGVHVSEGQHTILLKFRPTEWFVGTVITVSYNVLLLIMLLLYGKRKYMRRVKIEN